MRGRATENDDDRVVMFKVPELATSRAAEAWWASLLAYLPGDLPRPSGVRILDFHDHVTSTLDDTDAAIQFHSGIDAHAVKYVKRCGEDGKVESFRHRPPHIKRRGAALHTVYALLDGKARTGEENIKQVHRSRGPQPYTLYYAMHRDTENIRLLVAASWNDSGAKVISEIVTEPDISAEAQAALQALAGAPVPSGFPQPQASLHDLAALAGPLPSVHGTRRHYWAATAWTQGVPGGTRPRCGT